VPAVGKRYLRQAQAGIAFIQAAYDRGRVPCTAAPGTTLSRIVLRSTAPAPSQFEVETTGARQASEPAEGDSSTPPQADTRSSAQNDD
jgi:hypothetical protein